MKTGHYIIVALLVALLWQWYYLSMQVRNAKDDYANEIHEKDAMIQKYDVEKIAQCEDRTKIVLVKKAELKEVQQLKDGVCWSIDYIPSYLQDPEHNYEVKAEADGTYTVERMTEDAQ